MTNTPFIQDVSGPDRDVMRQTVNHDLTRIPLADANEPLRFAERLLIYLREWVVANADPQCARDDAAIFVFSEYPRQEAPREKFERIPLFDDLLTHPMPGHVHLCTTGVAEVHRCMLQGTSSQEALGFLTKKRWEARPTVVFYPARKIARYYPYGLNNETERDEYALHAPAPQVTQAVVGKVLDRYYDVGLRVPSSAVRVWKNPDGFIPVEHAEKAIQDTLAFALRMYISCIVTPEWNVDGTASRADIGIIPSPGDTGHRCIIEVKALRSHWSTGSPCTDTENEEAVAKGLNQAVDYCTRTSSHYAFLAVYDLRRIDDDGIRQKFAAHAKKRKVDFRRYFVYNNSEAERRSQPDSAFNLIERGSRRRKSKK